MIETITETNKKEITKKLFILYDLQDSGNK